MRSERLEIVRRSSKRTSKPLVRQPYLIESQHVDKTMLFCPSVLTIDSSRTTLISK